MSGLYAQYETDPELEKNGILLNLGLNSKEKMMTITLARAGGANVAYTKRAELVLKPYRRQIQTETISNELLMKLLDDVFIDTCVKGWDNMEDRQGNDLPFSRANVVTIFTDLPMVKQDAKAASDKAALYRLSVNEGIQGN